MWIISLQEGYVIITSLISEICGSPVIVSSVASQQMYWRKVHLLVMFGVTALVSALLLVQEEECKLQGKRERGRDRWPDFQMFILLCFHCEQPYSNFLRSKQPIEMPKLGSCILIHFCILKK